MRVKRRIEKLLEQEEKTEEGKNIVNNLRLLAKWTNKDDSKEGK